LNSRWQRIFPAAAVHGRSKTIAFRFVAVRLSSRSLSEITFILERTQKGDQKAAEELLPLVYDELRKLASFRFQNERPGQTLQATALVHEAWLRLAPGQEGERLFANRAHFFSAAAEAMRRILIDRARRRAVLERGGFKERDELTESSVVSVDSTELMAVHEGLDELATEDPQAADLVKLRYFVGMSMPEAAEALGLPLRSAERLWTFARAWLRDALGR
jgi:RNA polymerase sigma factor (TIGR02999 family)